MKAKLNFSNFQLSKNVKKFIYLFIHLFISSTNIFIECSLIFSFPLGVGKEMDSKRKR